MIHTVEHLDMFIILADLMLLVTLIYLIVKIARKHKSNNRKGNKL
jgi:hypothetical protein